MLVYTNSFLFVNNSFRILSFSVTTTSSAKRLRCLKYQVKLIKSKLYFVKENNMYSKKTQKLSIKPCICGFSIHSNDLFLIH